MRARRKMSCFERNKRDFFARKKKSENTTENFQQENKQIDKTIRSLGVVFPRSRKQETKQNETKKTTDLYLA